MKEIHEYEKDLASIRSTMDRSAKFLSLSGLSGILAGCYALAGASAAYSIAQYPIGPGDHRYQDDFVLAFMVRLLVIAIVVLVLSIGTALWLSNNKAKRAGTSLWNATSRQLVINFSIPLIAGGLFVLILLFNGMFEMAASATLVFYGLGLIAAGANTFGEVRYLGFFEIVLGLASAAISGYELIFWSLGFGVLHIIYGAILYNKYDR